MRLLSAFLSGTLLFSQSVQADVFDAFDDLKPVNTWISEDCTNSQDLTSECGSCCCCPELRAPNMMGDGGFGVPTSLIFQFQNHLTKVAENNSVLPQDRFSVNWTLANDVELRSGLFGLIPGDDRDLNEFKIRYEKTFADGNFSIEGILPINATTSTDQTFVIPGNLALTEEVELGNIAFNFKALLLEDDTSALSVGLLWELPTAQEQNLAFVGLPGVLQIQNDAHYLTPWIGYLKQFGENTYWQTFASYRMNTERNDLVVGFPGGALQIGDGQAPDYFMLDTQLAHRIYDNQCSEGLTGIVPAVELHYLSTNETDPTGSFRTPFLPGFAIPPSIGSVDQLTLTLATNFEFGQKAALGVGLGIPLTEGNSTLPLLSSGPTNKPYDWSLMMNFNYYFGN